MDQILERHTLPKLTQKTKLPENSISNEEVDHNQYIYKPINHQIQSISLVKSKEHLRKKMAPILSNLFQKKDVEGTLPNTFL